MPSYLTKFSYKPQAPKSHGTGASWVTRVPRVASAVRAQASQTRYLRWGVKVVATLVTYTTKLSYRAQEPQNRGTCARPCPRVRRTAFPAERGRRTVRRVVRAYRTLRYNRTPTAVRMKGPEPS